MIRKFISQVSVYLLTRGVLRTILSSFRLRMWLIS